MVEAANGSRPGTIRLMYGFGVTSVALIAVFPVLPDLWRAVVFFALNTGAVVCVAYGRHQLDRRWRLPWTLLLAGLVVIVVANALRISPMQWTDGVRLFFDAAGNVLLLAAALALILRRGLPDLGGIIDTTIVALAVGGLLWGALLPHRLGTDVSEAAQINLFVVVYALTGVLGALLRLWHTLPLPRMALWWLMLSIALGIGANVALAEAAANEPLATLAEMLFMAAFAAVGLFGLDPSSLRLFMPGGARDTEELSWTRLVLLGVAAAATPVVIGAREALGGRPGGLLLVVQGALVAALVMARIGLLSAQRAEAERALRHQASHDPLTHLPNRREFVAQLSEQLARGRRCVILFCDLDDFKIVNDRYGHDAGDRLLIEVADRLTACLRRPHLVSRFGGDEFVILLTDITPAQAHTARSQVTGALAQPSQFADGGPISVSVGLSLADRIRDPEELIRVADRDMYRTKAARNAPT